ncbi:MAG TPA: hypothetical protein VGP93_18960 [Polyangiaceae bacterium]|nr:hypothetical protein [Polyangiaceae bacterium]
MKTQLLQVGAVFVALGCTNTAAPNDTTSPAGTDNGSAGQTGSDTPGAAGDTGDGGAATPFVPGNVWMTSGGNAKIFKLDAGREEVDVVLDVGTEPTSIAWSNEVVWYARNGKFELEGVSQDGILEATSVPEARDVFSADGRVWSTSGQYAIASVDPATGTVIQTINLENQLQDSLLVDSGAVWVMAGNSIVRVDIAAEAVTGTIDLETIGAAPGMVLAEIASGEGFVWALVAPAVDGPGYLLQIDPALASIVNQLTFPTVDWDDGLAVGYGSVWVSLSATSQILRLDPQTLATQGEVLTPDGHPEDLATGAGSVWAVDLQTSNLWRVNPDDYSVHSIWLQYPPSDLVVLGE